MKIFKKISVVLFAFIMAMTVAVFAACQPVENQNDKDKNNDKVVNTEVQNLITALSSQSVEYVDFNMEVSVESIYKNIYKNYNISNQKATVTGKFDVLNGNGDVVAVLPEEYSYLFLRDWDMYGYDSKSEVVDFSGITLNNAGSIKDYFNQVPELSGIDIGQLVSALYVPVTAAAAVEAAEELNALKIENGKVTVDVNLMLHNALLKVKAFFDKITDNTTIGQFLALDEIKWLIEEATAGVSGANLQTMLSAMLLQIEMSPAEEGSTVTVGQKLAEIGINVSLSSLAVPADANSTAYDYIVKFISSDEINTFIDQVLKASGSETTMPANLNDIKLSFISSALGIPSIEIYKEAINASLNFITETGILIPAEGTEKITTISGVKIIYTVNSNNVLTGQRVEAKIVVPEKNSESTCKISADITFPSAAPDLIDLGLNNDDAMLGL